MRLSCAGKTFLIGEYLAMDGGPSILVSTGPRFEMRFEKSGTPGAAAGAVSARSPKSLPFHYDSPAGLLYRKHESKFGGIEITFHDPNQGLGGLGASSAQFILLYAYVHNWVPRDSWASAVHLHPHGVLTSSSTSQSRLAAPLDWQRILIDYRDCAWNGEGIAPSGADIVSQVTGQITVYDGRSFHASEYAWPFADLEFTLLRTGLKLATHEHLRRQKDALPNEQMRVYVGHAVEALREAFVLQSTHAKQAICAAVSEFADVLRNSGLTADKSVDMLEKIRKIPGVLAAKGCGAMGADILLVLHEPGVEIPLAPGTSIAGTSRDLSGGLKIYADSQSLG